jgi:hypothetical protein
LGQTTNFNDKDKRLSRKERKMARTNHPESYRRFAAQTKSLSAPLAGEVPRSGKGGCSRAQSRSVNRKAQNKKGKGKRQTETTNNKGGFAHPPSLSGLPPQGGQTKAQILTTTENGFSQRAQNGKDKGI